MIFAECFSHIAAQPTFNQLVLNLFVVFCKGKNASEKLANGRHILVRSDVSARLAQPFFEEIHDLRAAIHDILLRKFTTNTGVRPESVRCFSFHLQII